MNELRKCAEILVECGYVPRYFHYMGKTITLAKTEASQRIQEYELCNPFIDTIEGRRQADAIEDWLYSLTRYNNNYKGLQLWEASIEKVSGSENRHQFRLDRIKWCIEQLIKQ